MLQEPRAEEDAQAHTVRKRHGSENESMEGAEGGRDRHRVLLCGCGTRRRSTTPLAKSSRFYVRFLREDRG
jgi:hypothetical protein